MRHSLQAVSDGFDSCIRDAVRVAETGYCYTRGLLCVSVPDWQGWNQIDFTREQTFGHLARWEIYFVSGTKELTTILRLTWPSLTGLLLKFIYPDDRGIVSMITRGGRIALLDRPLRNGEPDPFSRGMMLEQIPSDPPEWLGLDWPFSCDWVQ